jgi:hypothetical protein
MSSHFIIRMSCHVKISQANFDASDDHIHEVTAVKLRACAPDEVRVRKRNLIPERGRSCIFILNLYIGSTDQQILHRIAYRITDHSLSSTIGMSDYILLNLTGLPLSIDTPDKTASSSIVDRNVTALITDRDRPDQVVTATLPLKSRRIRNHDVGWREIPLKIASDRASFRTDKVPLLDKVADIVTDSQDIPGYKAFFKQVSTTAYSSQASS